MRATLEPSPSVWLQPLVTAVISAVVGALAAYLFTRLLWREQKKSDGRISAIKELQDQVSSIEKICLEYWVSQRSELGDAVCDAMEIRILTSIKLLERTLREQANSNSDMDLWRFHNEVRNGIDSLYDEATGGDFRSAMRKPDPTTAHNISRICLELEILLRSRIRSEHG